MSKKISASKGEFEALVKETYKWLPSKAPSGMRKMLDVLCEKISPEDLEFFDEVILSEMAKAHWEMAHKRKKGNPEFRIYSPAPADGEHRKTIIDFVSDDMAFLVDSIAA